MRYCEFDDTSDVYVISTGEGDERRYETHLRGARGTFYDVTLRSLKHRLLNLRQNFWLVPQSALDQIESELAHPHPSFAAGISRVDPPLVAALSLRVTGDARDRDQVLVRFHLDPGVSRSNFFEHVRVEARRLNVQLKDGNPPWTEEDE